MLLQEAHMAGSRVPNALISITNDEVPCADLKQVV
jgi:hypothetical protein